MGKTLNMKKISSQPQFWHCRLWSMCFLIWVFFNLLTNILRAIIRVKNKTYFRNISLLNFIYIFKDVLNYWLAIDPTSQDDKFWRTENWEEFVTNFGITESYSLEKNKIFILKNKFWIFFFNQLQTVYRILWNLEKTWGKW